MEVVLTQRLRRCQWRRMERAARAAPPPPPSSTRTSPRCATRRRRPPVSPRTCRSYGSWLAYATQDLHATASSNAVPAAMKQEPCCSSMDSRRMRHPELAVGRQSRERALLQRHPGARQQQCQERGRMVQRDALRRCRRCMPHLPGPGGQGFQTCSSMPFSIGCRRCMCFWRGPESRALQALLEHALYGCRRCVPYLQGPRWRGA